MRSHRRVSNRVFKWDLRCSKSALAATWLNDRDKTRVRETRRGWGHEGKRTAAWVGVEISKWFSVFVNSLPLFRRGKKLMTAYCELSSVIHLCAHTKYKRAEQLSSFDLTEALWTKFRGWLTVRGLNDSRVHFFFIVKHHMLSDKLAIPVSFVSLADCHKIYNLKKTNLYGCAS